MSLKLGTTDIAGIPTGLIDTVNSKADVNTTANATIFNTQGKSLIGGLCMPSSRYIDLTLGASGTTYTAPANGYFSVSIISTGVGQYIYIGSTDYKRLGFQCCSSVSDEYIKYSMPVKSGEQILINYNLGGDKELYFTYAEGDE